MLFLQTNSRAFCLSNQPGLCNNSLHVKLGHHKAHTENSRTAYTGKKTILSPVHKSQSTKHTAV